MIPGITTNQDLYSIARKLNLHINYIGFAENLIDIPKKNGIYIINLGDNRIGGTHWTILYIKGKQAFYSDSYGMPPEDFVIDFVKPSKLDYNTIQLQPIDKNFCGQWAMLTAYFLKNGSGDLKKRFDEFKDHFTSL